MQTDGISRPATQGPLPAQPGALPSGKAGGAGAARVLPQPPDLMLRKSGAEGTLRPRTQAPLPALTTAGLDLAEQHQRAEIARLAGEAGRLAGQKQDLQLQVDEQVRLLHDVRARLSQAEQHAEEQEVPRGSALSEHLAAASRAEAAAAAVPELRRQVFRIDWQHKALEQELESTTARLQEVQQRLAEAQPGEHLCTTASPAMTPATPATPVTPATPPGSATPGISPEDLRKALQTALEAGTAHAAQARPPREQVPAAEAAPTGSPPAALSALELRQLHSALPHGGAAVTRLARRARLQEPRSRFDRLRAPLQRAPRPLEGQLLERFGGMVRDDIAALARKSGQPPLQAAELMQRAVRTGVLGASLPAQAREQLAQALEEARAHLAAPMPPATAEGPAAPAAPPPRPAAINKLGSGVTLDLMRDPQASIATLNHDQVANLLAALGLGTPDADELEFSRQKSTAVRLLKHPINPMHQDSRIWEESLAQDLPADALVRLKEAMDIAHVGIGVTRKFNHDRSAAPMYQVEFRFGGSQNVKDDKQNVRTALGGVGPVYKATDTVAAIMADLLKHQGHRYEISVVSGASMGGGTAQAFLAGVESRTPLPVSPPLVLLDPQLLNDAQARAATRNGTHGYDFQKQRGVALSLDYAGKPHKGVMDIMKGPGGYRHPGLMHIRLGLAEGDGPRGGRNAGKPETMPLPLGYHANDAQYRHAIWRFTRDVGALSEAGTQALIAKFERRAPPLQPLAPQITPASPREDGPSVSPRMRTGGSHEPIRPVPASAAAGSGVTAALPQGPSPLVDAAGTALGELLTQDSSAPAKTRPKGVAINKLNSGVKVDLSHQPEATLANLQPQELAALFQALKLGHPKSDERELHDQKRQARAVLDGFCDKLPDLMNTSRVFDGPSESVKHLKRPLPELTRRRLEAMAEIAHCKVHVSEVAAPGGSAALPKVRLDIYFGALENWRDVRQVFKTVAGGRGAVYKAADEVAAILADPIRALKGNVEIGFVSGASLGGGTAQVFLAGLESRVRLPESPPLILLDPPLLNNTQSRQATRQGEIGYDFEKPRGVAISLDYDKDPRRGLIGVMKGPGGYKYPGLLHLRLGLQDTDGPEGGRPVASRLGLGYHHRAEEFFTAIRRFTSDLGEGPPPSPSFRDRESGATASMRSDRSGPSGT